MMPPPVTASEVSADRWEGVPRDRLAARWVVPELRLFEMVGSTNDVARRLSAGGALAGTVVIADRQLAGRGRVGRHWHSPAGTGLWLSMIAPAPGDAAAAGALPLRVGVAVARALDRFVETPVGLKWPNDLVLGGRKLGGILCEGAWEGPVAGTVVVGVGLNLLQRPVDFPVELRRSATSLAMAAPAPVSRLGVADALVPALRRALEGDSLSPAELASELHARDVLRGGEVRVTEPSTGALLGSGTAMGIAPDGALLIRSHGGALRSVRSGTARAAMPAVTFPEDLPDT